MTLNVHTATNYTGVCNATALGVFDYIQKVKININTKGKSTFSKLHEPPFFKKLIFYTKQYTQLLYGHVLHQINTDKYKTLHTAYCTMQNI